MNVSYLDKINSPKDLKKLSVKELESLCAEIRERIIAVSKNNGGHLASSLGAVESIVALYYVFDFPKDKLIFDVGHQAYAHKILSERKDLFDTIRKEGGLSGFPNIFESEYDAFSTGHAGNSISASLGFAAARDKLKEDYYVISFVGDASFVNGENLEALFADDRKPEKFMIVLNDNGMSISKNSNGLYKVLTKISTKKSYSKFMHFMDKIFGWNFIGRFLKRIKAAFKRSLDAYGMLDTIGVKYVGPFDGHNIKLLVNLFNNFKSSPRATLLHIKTKKGKGLGSAEDQAEKFHGVSKNFASSKNDFSDAVSGVLKERFDKDDKIVAVTAAMALGTGLLPVQKEYPERVFDVGISEEFGVTYAAGMARAGLKPIVFMYSTFLQRAFDQALTDVCLQKLPVIFMIDRAGFVGADGVTHQGLFDLSYLMLMPNMKIFAPKDVKELGVAIDYALSLCSPVAIRYPNGEAPSFDKTTPMTDNSLWETLREGGSDNVALCVGPRAIKLAIKAFEGKGVTIVNARSVKPLDKAMLDKFADATIVTVEENCKFGGFGSAVLSYYAETGARANVKVVAVKDKFIEHASVDSQMEAGGLSLKMLSGIFEQ